MTTTTLEAATDAAPATTAKGASFDSSTKWKRSSKVGLRPEPFGALAYHFDTRRLVFLKSPKLVELVEGLVEHESADIAIDAIIEPETERRRRSHVTALASLAEAGVIEPVLTDSPTKIAFVG